MFPFYIEKLLLQEEEKVYDHFLKNYDSDEQTKTKLFIDWCKIYKYQNNLK
jgi:hypothetical protein